MANVMTNSAKPNSKKRPEMKTSNQATEYWGINLDFPGFNITAVIFHRCGSNCDCFGRFFYCQF